MGMSITIPDKVFTDLDRLEKKIMGLETTTNRVSAGIVSAFMQMANGVDPFIQKVGQAQKSISALMAGANTQKTGFLRVFGEMADAVNRMFGGKRKTMSSFGDPAELSRLTSELKRQQKEIERLNKSIERMNATRSGSASSIRAAAVAETTFRRAMFSTEGTMTQRINKIARLREAERLLTETGRGYSRQIEIIRKEIARLNAVSNQQTAAAGRMRQSQSHMMDIWGQLQRRIALVFSVSQITQYVQTLARVRGEFELQNAALTAILQNKDEADKLFGQITELAVRSPFRLSELVRYTKELAAYRVESEKLYDTTKMLADVSSGLGVDMSRLILAYGQVKAANYLRGTELRQFSEAGINILGELATYFSEIENRAVSVGEVFEMVSNRMVTFADVEEIFRRITSEGGIFANMQEVQSRTLVGMMSNMKDSVDIMLNDIGEANEELLKGSVQAVTNLMHNWHEVVQVVKELAVVLGPVAAYFTLARVASSKFAWALLDISTKIPRIGTGIANIYNYLTQTTNRSLLAQKAFSGLGKVLGGLATLGTAAVLGAIVVGLVELWRSATQASREAKRLKKELDGIFSEDTYNARNTVAMYKELVEKLKDVNQGSQEHRDIIAKLNSQYGDYIGYIVTEKTSYDQLKESIDAVTESIMKRARANTEEKALQKIYEKNSKDITDQQDRIRRQMSVQGSYFTSFFGRAATEKEINAIFGLIEARTRKLGRELSSVDLIQILSEFYEGAYFTGNNKLGDELINAVTQYSRSVLTILEEEEAARRRINNLYGQQYTSVKHIEEIQANNAAREEELNDLYENRGNITQWQYNQEKARIEQLHKLKEIDINVKFGLFTKEEGERQKNAILHWATATIADVNKQIEEDLKKLDFSDELISNFQITPKMQQSGIPEIEKSVIENYRQTEESIKRQNRLKESGNRIDEEQLKSLENKLKGYYAMAEALGIVDLLEKKSGCGRKKDPVLERLENQMRLIKEVGKEYEKLKKEYGDFEAGQQIIKGYAESFQDEGFAPDFISTMTFDTSGLLQAFQRLMEEYGEKYSAEIQKNMDGLTAEVGIEVRVSNRDRIKKEVEELFTDYKLTTELSEIGGTEEMASALGFEFVSLDDLIREGYAKAAELRREAGEENIKEAKDIEKRIGDAQTEQLRRNTKKYLRLLIQSRDERTRIEEEYRRQSEEIRASELTPEQKEQATANITKTRDESLAKLAWNEFKGLDLYRMAFEDLERVGTRALDMLMDELVNFSETTGKVLPTEDFRELVNALKRVRDELAMRNPFKTLIDSIKEAREAMKDLRTAKWEQSFSASGVMAAEENRNAAWREVNMAEEAVSSATTEDQRTAALARLAAAQANLEMTTDALVVATEELAEADGHVVDAENRHRESVDTVDKVLNKLSSEYDAISGSINSAIDAVMEFADGLGLTFSDEATAAIEGFQKGFSVLGSVMSAIVPIITMITIGGYEMQAALWPLLVIGAALGAVFAIVSSVDAARQKIIDDETENVERLKEQYDELSENAENALSVADMNTDYERAFSNLRKQLASINRAISASSEKKKQDEEELQDLYSQRASIMEEMESLETQRIQNLGGFGDDASVKDAAQEFVDSWLDAYRANEDGLDALMDKWNEYIETVIANQMRLRITEKFLEPIMKEMDSMLDDNVFSPEEAERLRAMVEEASPALNEALTTLAEQYKIAKEESEGSLSGLQRGIQGVTEDTAQVLESLLNSVRYYTADSNMQLRSIYAMLSGNEAVPNPMLSELRAQTAQIKAINRLIRNVTASGHPNGGDGIKIFMN